MLKRTINQPVHRRAKWRAGVGWCLVGLVSLLFTGCFGESEPEPYYGRAVSPVPTELRWSAGGSPKVFDPARASASPDLDVVRALYEGLTNYNSQTQTIVAGVAQHWEASADKREWTFYLRKNAKWSNGDTVTAQDFVRSWRRVRELGAQAPYGKLLENILGANPLTTVPESPAATESATTPTPLPATMPTPSMLAGLTSPTPPTAPLPTPVTAAKLPELGVSTISEFVFKVHLQQPSPDFPALTAHPVFRPVHKSLGLSETIDLTKLVTNGAFRLADDSQAGQIVLEKAPAYWNAEAVVLPRVRFVAVPDAETALTLYRGGELDVVTNANFAPLALKLLTPYKDFRRNTYAALTYYQFNPVRAPFDNIKVRTALTLAIDRERLIADALDGINEPANTFLINRNASDNAGGIDKDTVGSSKEKTKANSNTAETEKSKNKTVPTASPLPYDKVRAQALLAESGFPGGLNFPPIHLLISRNDQQKQVARAVAAMWQRELGIKTEIISKNWDEYQSALQSADYDVARRSVVLPTTDETTGLHLLFPPPEVRVKAAPTPGATPELTATPTPVPVKPDVLAAAAPNSEGISPVLPAPAPTPFLPFTDETAALNDLPAVPLYFASSYSLVKPYVIGFNTDLLDAPMLNQVYLDKTWQPPPATGKEWFSPALTPADKMLP